MNKESVSQSVSIKFDQNFSIAGSLDAVYSDDDLVSSGGLN